MSSTRDAIDNAIRAHAAERSEREGELVTTWIVIAATRSLDGGSAVTVVPEGGGMPAYQMKGLLVDALDAVRGLD